MITREEKRAYEKTRKDYFIRDFLRCVVEKNGLGSLSCREVAKNSVLLEYAFNCFESANDKDTTYNDALRAVIRRIDNQIKGGIYFCKLWRFVRCDLDDERYAYAEYEFFDTLNEGKESCFKELAFDPMYGNGDIQYNEIFSPDKPNSFRFTQKQENCYHVTEILPYEAKGEYVCIWHHAYEGVDFKVLFVGFYKECMEYAKSSAQKEYENFDGAEYSEFDNQFVVDDGYQWRVWDVVKLPE